MTKKPWMPLYIGDYLRKTAHLNAAGSGAYLHLIMHYWDHGSLPDDDAQLARIAKLTPKQFSKMRPLMASFFQPGWRHDRIDEELQRVVSTNEKRSRAGVVGAAKRWQMPFRKNGRAIHTTHKNITTTETVPRESKKAASRASKETELDASPELTEEMRKRWGLS